MNFEQIALIGEFVGGLGVLATLVFLLFEVRGNSRILKANAKTSGIKGFGWRTLRQLELSRAISVNARSAMTEYELSHYMSSIMGNFLTALTVYFSVITAYVIAAFSAGSRLSRIQLLLVNLCFAVAAGVTGFLAVVIFNRFWVFAQRVPNPDGAGNVTR